MCFFVVGSCQVDNAVTYVEFQSFRKHCHRTYYKNVFAVNFVEVRAFPHLAKFCIAVIQNGDIFPFETIGASVKEDTAVSIVCHIGDNSIEITIVFFPDLRVTEIYFASAFRDIVSGDDRVVLVFLIINAIANSHTLCLVSRKFSVCHRGIAYISNSGIHQKMTSIRKLQSTS